MPTYEVFKQFGGHCGPFQSLDEAVIYSKRIVKREGTCAIHERTIDGVGGYAKDPTMVITRQALDYPQS